MSSQSESSTLITQLFIMPLFTHESTDRVILVNPATQAMTVYELNANLFDAFFNDLMKKEGHPPASKASIDNMPVFEVKGTDECDECAICLEEWRDGDVAKEMPCKHRFHGGCVERWLKVHGTCPVCRFKMPVDDSLDNNKVGDESGRDRELWMTFAVVNQESHES